jgi:20S proteasome alpha/beta subunit
MMQPPPPKHYARQRRLSEEKSLVTIAIGLLCKEGLLLCADTQYTIGGGSRLHGTKLLPYEYDDGSKSVFATSGHAQYARMCVQFIQDYIEHDVPKDARTLRRFHRVVAAAIKDLYEDHIFKHPITDEIEVALLCGFWSAKEKKLGFFSTRDTAVNRMHGYECVGSGSVLAHQSIRRIFKRVVNAQKDKQKQTEREVRDLAFTALEAVKEYDVFCSGDNQCILLSNDGALSKRTNLIRPKRSGARK